MKQLSEVEPEIEIEVKRIDGGSEVTGYLRELDIEEGEKGKASKVIGGTELKEKFEQIGVAEGKEIMLVRKEAPAPSPKRGAYVLAKIGEHFVTIGKGLAEKVSVE